MIKILVRTLSRYLANRGRDAQPDANREGQGATVGSQGAASSAPTGAGSKTFLWLGALAGALFFLGLWRNISLLRLVAKPIPVLCLALWVVAERRDRYAKAIAAGFALSALGDLFNETGEGTFLLAVGSFLIAHLCYTFAFMERTRSLRPLIALPFVVWGVTAYRIVMPNLHEMAIPAVVYMTVICAMMWRATAARVAHPSDSACRAGAIGAILFGLSDTLIALNKWHAPIPGASYYIMVLYWAGQIGIALSAKCA